MRIVPLLIRTIGPYTDALAADLSSPVFKDLVYLDLADQTEDKQEALGRELQRIATTPSKNPLSLGIESTIFVLVSGAEEDHFLASGLCIGGQVNLVSHAANETVSSHFPLPLVDITLKHFYAPVVDAPPVKAPEKGKGKPDSKQEAPKKIESYDYKVGGKTVPFSLLLSIAQELLSDIMHRRLYMEHLRASRAHNISGHSVWLDIMPPALTTPDCPLLNSLYDVTLLKDKMMRLYTTRINSFTPTEQNDLAIILGVMVDAVILSAPDPSKTEKAAIASSSTLEDTDISRKSTSFDGAKTANAIVTKDQQRHHQQQNHIRSQIQSQSHSLNRSRRTPSVSNYDLMDLNSNSFMTGSALILDESSEEAGTAKQSGNFMLFPMRAAIHSENVSFTTFEEKELYTHRFCFPPGLDTGFSRINLASRDVSLWDIGNGRGDGYERYSRLQQGNTAPKKDTVSCTSTSTYDVYVATLDHCISEAARTYKKRILDMQISNIDLQTLIEDYLPEKNHIILDNFKNLSPRTIILRRSDFQELIRLFLKESPQALSIQEAETLVRKTLVLHMNELLMSNTNNASDDLPIRSILDITGTLEDAEVNKSLQNSTIIKLGTKSSEACNRLSYYTALIMNPLIPLLNRAYFEPLTNSLCLTQSLIPPNAEGVILRMPQNSNETIWKIDLLRDIQHYLLNNIKELSKIVNAPYDPLTTLAATVPNYTEWLTALQEFSPVVERNAAAPEEAPQYELCYCYAENPEEFVAFTKDVEQGAAKISPHRKRKPGIISQFIDFIMETVTATCLETYSSSLTKPSATQEESGPAESSIKGMSLTDDNFVDNAEQFTSPNVKGHVESAEPNGRPQGSRTKQREMSDSSTHDMQLILSHSQTGDAAPALDKAGKGNQDSNNHLTELDGFEPIMEDAEGEAACASNLSDDSSSLLSTMFISDAQWIYFYSDNVPCLMAQLGPIASIKPESCRDFFVRQYATLTADEAQKAAPVKGKAPASKDKADKAGATQVLAGIRPEDAANVSLELALALLFFELYGDEPSAYILNILLSVLNQDYEDLITEECYAKQPAPVNQLRLSNLKKPIRKPVGTVYYTQESDRVLHCTYLKQQARNKDVFIIETLRAALLESHAAISAPVEKGKDSKQKEQQKLENPQEENPLLKKFSKSPYADIQPAPLSLPKSVFLDSVKASMPSFSICPNYCLRSYSTFYLAPNDKSIIASAPLRRRIDFYRMWASISTKSEADLSAPDYADHFLLLPDTDRENNLSRSMVTQQTDVGDGLMPLTTSLPTAAALKIIFGDKSMAIIKQYTMLYSLAKYGIYVDISFLQASFGAIETDSKPAEPNPAKPPSKPGSQSQSRGGAGQGARGSVSNSRPMQGSQVEEPAGTPAAQEPAPPKEPPRTLMFNTSFDENILQSMKPELSRFALIAEICGAIDPAKADDYSHRDRVEFSMYSDAFCSVKCNGVQLLELSLADDQDSKIRVTTHTQLGSLQDSIDTVPNFFSDIIHEVIGFLTECNLSNPGQSLNTSHSNKASTVGPRRDGAQREPSTYSEEVESGVFLTYAKLIPDVGNIAVIKITDSNLLDANYKNETHAIVIELPLFNILVVRFLVSRTTLFLVDSGDAILIEGSYMHLFKHNTASISLMQVRSSPSTLLLPSCESPDSLPIYSSPLVLYVSQGFPLWNAFFEQRKKWLVTRKIPARINFNPKSRPHLGQQHIAKEHIVLKDTLTLTRQICEAAYKEYSELLAVYPCYRAIFKDTSIWRMHHESFVLGTDSTVVPLRGVTRFLLGSPEEYAPDSCGQSASPFPPSLSVLDWTGNTFFCRLGCSFNADITKYVIAEAPTPSENAPSKDKPTPKKNVAPTSASSNKRTDKKAVSVTASSAGDGSGNANEKSDTDLAADAASAADHVPLRKEERIMCYNATRPFLPPVISPKVQSDVVVELERVLQAREEKVMKRISRQEQQALKPVVDEVAVSKGPKKTDKDKTKDKDRSSTPIKLDPSPEEDEPMEVHRELTDILNEVNPIKIYSALQLFFRHFSEIALQKAQLEASAAVPAAKGKDAKVPPAPPVIVESPRTSSAYLLRKELPQTPDDLLEDCLQDPNSIPLPCTSIISPRFLIYPISPDLRNGISYNIEDECMGYLQNCEPWICLHSADISYLKYIGILHPLIGTRHYTAIGSGAVQSYFKITTTGRLYDLPNYLFSVPFSSGILQLLMATRSALSVNALTREMVEAHEAFDVTQSSVSRGRTGPAKGVLSKPRTNTSGVKNITLPSRLLLKGTELESPDSIPLESLFGEYFLALFEPNNPYIPRFNSLYAANSIEFLEMHAFFTKDDRQCFRNLEQTKINWKLSAAQRDVVINNYQKIETTGIQPNKALLSVISLLKKEKKQREREATRELEQRRELERQMALLAEQRKHSEEEDKNEVSYDYSVDKPTKSARLRKNLSGKHGSSMPLPRIANLSPPPPDWKRSFTEEDLSAEYTGLSYSELRRKGYVAKYPLLKHVPAQPQQENDSDTLLRSTKVVAQQVLNSAMAATTLSGVMPLRESTSIALRAIPQKINIRQKLFNALIKNQTENTFTLSISYDTTALRLVSPEKPFVVLPHASIDLHFCTKIRRETEIVVTGETDSGEAHSVTISCTERIAPLDGKTMR